MLERFRLKPCRVTHAKARLDRAYVANRPIRSRTGVPDALASEEYKKRNNKTRKKSQRKQSTIARSEVSMRRVKKNVMLGSMQSVLIDVIPRGRWRGIPRQ